jgi:formiminotetrahydrofolate cyclodeaminase
MEEALRGGSMVPMKIMQTSARALELTAVFAEKGSRMAVSDAGCAAAACKAALQAASLNVFINTRSMKDREYAQRLEKQAEDLLQEYNTLADRIFDSVTAGLRGQQ